MNTRQRSLILAVAAVSIVGMLAAPVPGIGFAATDDADGLQVDGTDGQDAQPAGESGSDDDSSFGGPTS